jgi:hypothetical protein
MGWSKAGILIETGGTMNEQGYRFSAAARDSSRPTFQSP